MTTIQGHEVYEECVGINISIPFRDFIMFSFYFFLIGSVPMSRNLKSGLSFIPIYMVLLIVHIIMSLLC